jgi:hypothetical protein
MNDINKVQNILLDAKKQAAVIRDKLNLGELSLSKAAKFVSFILKLLETLNFKTSYTDIFNEIEGYGHLPSMTIFYSNEKKTAGGHIYIYKGYSVERKRELLIHEFIHIYDDTIPTWFTDSTDYINGYMLSKQAINDVELITDLISMELMIPIQQLQIDLFDCSYDIDNIVFRYKGIKISSILRWLIIHDYYNAHFAVLYKVKNEENNSNIKHLLRHDEYFRDKNAKDIYNIVFNKNSKAYECIDKKDKCKGDSIINNKDYQCFCYYKENIPLPLPPSADQSEMVRICDEIVIIGWSQEMYEHIKKLRFK